MLQPRPEPLVRSDRADAPISERGTTALRAALQGLLRQPDQEASLRCAVRNFCGEARHHEMRAEQIIIVFKRVWHSLPEVQTRDSSQRQQLLERIITICVEEYYSEQEQ